MSNYVSLTYRPPTGCLPPIDKFLSIINTNKVIRYYIGSEKAKSETINHYQVWLNIKSRIDNYSKTIKPNLDYPDKVALKIETIKLKDINYVLGYCQKEQLEHRTNIPEEDLKTATKDYEVRMKVLTNGKKEQCSLGIDQIFRMLVAKHQELKLKSFDENLFKMFIRHYSKEISYTTRSKIRMETLQYHINIELEDEMYKVGTNYNSENLNN